MRALAPTQDLGVKQPYAGARHVGSIRQVKHHAIRIQKTIFVYVCLGRWAGRGERKTRYVCR